MTEEPENDAPAEAEPPDAQDWLLTQLVYLANAIGEFNLGVTLCVGGMLITGTLVGGRQWTDSLVAELRGGGAVALGDFLQRELHEKYPESRAGEGEDDESEDEGLPFQVGYVHLIDAHVIFGGSNPVPANRGLSWRGRLSSVDGWTLGTLGPPT